MSTRTTYNETNGRTSLTQMLRFAVLSAIVTSVLVARTASGQEHDHDHAGHCIDRGGLGVMFEPDTSREEAEDIAAVHSNATVAFVPNGGTWQLTATDGVVDSGQPMTLTYSFVPDGTPIFSSYADDGTVSNLFATMDANFPGGRAAWKQLFADMFAEWSRHTNITYVEVSDDGEPWSMFNFGAPGQRGDIRIAMHPVGAGPLAYNSYPDFGGDMVLDSLDIDVFTNSTNDFRALRNTLLHEHGHGLGMAHVIPQNGTKLMEPALNTGFDGPQEDDIRAAQFLYGDAMEPNDEPLAAPFIGETQALGDPDTFGVQTLTIEGVALERSESSDWYAFTAFGGSRFAGRLEPIGTTYDFGPQDGTAQTIDASAARDLGLRIYRRASAETGELLLINQIDFNGAGEAENLPMLLYTQAGMMYAEVYSTDGVDDVQGYRLTISNVAIEEPVDPPSMSVADGVVPVDNGDTFFMDATEVGQSSGKALTIRNTGDGPLRFEGTPRVIVEGVGAADFFADLAVSEIPSEGFAVLGLTFEPTQAGERVAVVRIPNNDPDAADYSFIIRGTAEAGEVLEPELLVADGVETVEDGDTLRLDETLVGETASLGLTVRNVGQDVLEFDGAPIVSGPGDAAFNVGFDAVTIQPDGLAVLGISFEPTEPGEHTTVITLPNNDSDEGDFSFVVSATALAATEAVLEVAWEGSILAANDLLDFEDVEVGITVDTELALTNIGDADLEISTIQVAGEAAVDYSDLSGVSGTIAPGETGVVALAVTPSQPGARDATLTIVSNAAAGPFTVGLTTLGFEDVEIVDCNENGIDDANDLLDGSEDCNANTVPDECEEDFDGDGVIDACDNCADFPNPFQDDVNGDGVGDACEIAEDDPADEGDGDLDNDNDEPVEDEADPEEGDEGGKDDDLEEKDDTFTPQPIGGFCGAGAVGLLPAMMLGLGGMRPRRRR